MINSISTNNYNKPRLSFGLIDRKSDVWHKINTNESKKIIMSNSDLAKKLKEIESNKNWILSQDDKGSLKKVPMAPIHWVRVCYPDIIIKTIGNKKPEKRHVVIEGESNGEPELAYKFKEGLLTKHPEDRIPLHKINLQEVINSAYAFMNRFDQKVEK